MCGIVGTVVFEGGNFIVTASCLERMRDTMVHRGPDSAGIWIDSTGRIGLGHRRLSIIDLSAAAGQPMSNEDQTIWIVFNGEIYNHPEIRRELENLNGHTWKTDHSDTEIILHAFEQWGIECIHRFRGMFAIAIWDSRKRELWLIRDRIGIKPLYYSVHHGRITFASEIKALLQDPDQQRAVNEEAFYHYLSFLATPAPQTLFDGIRKLPGGTWLRVQENGHIEERRYWDVWDNVVPLIDVPDDEIAERVLSEFRTSVKLRKLSDVPVGVFLSGGIDSSANLALFADGDGHPVKSFSIGYDKNYHSYKNELNFARYMADIVGSEHFVRILDIDNLLEFLPQMVYLQDEPIADPVCMPIYYVSKLARDNGVTVAQVGEGADELFWGYPSWKQSLSLQKFTNSFLRFMPTHITKSFLSMNTRISDSIRMEWFRRAIDGKPIFWSGAEVFTEAHKKRLLHPRLKKKFADYSSWESIAPIYERFRNKAWEKSYLNWMSYVDLNLRLPELLLMRVDKMSMGVSLECRVPFLDHKFVELAMGIPESVKTRNGTLKYILKKAVNGLIPETIINRKKQGFGVPVYEWFFDRLGEKSKRELNDFCDQTDFFDKTEVRKLIENNRGWHIWTLLNFVMWWKRFIQ
jgi:asparagine synthase (glutamine-hydrolysing)